jgi:hypothetical protein
MQACRLVQGILDQDPQAVAPMVADRRARPGAVDQQAPDLAAEQLDLA